MAGERAALPLEGIRVVDVSTVLAAPVCATMFGDFGADVIKVEQPRVGDSMRWFGGQPGERSPPWVQESRNKRSATLDLRRPEGRQLLDRLLGQCDVLVTNFRVPTLRAWDLLPDDVLARHPHLVVCAITGFGLTGPYRDRGAFDRIAAAFSGQTYATGYPDRPPVRSGYSVIDYMGAYVAAFGVMTALYHRDARGGAGQVVDLGLYEAAFRATESSLLVHAAAGIVRERTGNRNPVMVPASDFDARDGRRVSVHAGTPALLVRLLRAIGRDDLIDDPRLADRAALVANQDVLYEAIEAWVAERTADEVVDTLSAFDVPAAVVMSVADIAADPHYRERGTVVDVDDPDFGTLPVAAPLPKLSATPGAIRRPAPGLGEHNREVWCGLAGLSDEELARLVERGVV